MYSIIGILSLVFAILMAIGGVVWYITLGCIYSDAMRVGTRAFETKADKEAGRETALKYLRLLTNKAIPVIYTLVFVFMIVVCIFSQRQLTKQECANSDGVWKTWDNGIQYECFNPNQIKTDNNFRILVED